MFQYQYNNDDECLLASGKVVCVGRNYAEHAKELNNPVPSSPLLFIKPSSALCDMKEPIQIPEGLGACHIETELALLIGKPLHKANTGDALLAIDSIGLAFDLTLRDLQSELKEKGHPWEKSKAFDRSCPVSPMVSISSDLDWSELVFELIVNGQRQQLGRCSDMIFSVAELLAEMSQWFSLQPGDLVLTGTPAGVMALASGMTLDVMLSTPLASDVAVSVKTQVA